jgi:hypothetical protein
VTIGPYRLLKHIEMRALAEVRPIANAAATMKAIAVRASSLRPCEAIVMVGNSQVALAYNPFTMVLTSATVGAAGYNMSGVCWSDPFARFMAVGNTEAVYESTFGTSWSLVAGASSAAHVLNAIAATNRAPAQYALAVGGTSDADAIYQFRTASSLTMLTAPKLFTKVVWTIGGTFVCAGPTTIYSFDSATSTSTLLETHPEGTCTVLDMFYHEVLSQVCVTLKLPSGAIRCTWVLPTGGAGPFRSVATSTIFGATAAMVGTWTRYNGPMYVYSGDGAGGTAGAKSSCGMLTKAPDLAAPQLNVAYDPLKATTRIHYGVTGSPVAIVRADDVVFLLAQQGASMILSELSDLLTPSS